MYFIQSSKTKWDSKWSTAPNIPTSLTKFGEQRREAGVIGRFSAENRYLGRKSRTLSLVSHFLEPRNEAAESSSRIERAARD